MRYARRVDFTLKSGQEKEFNKIFESKIIPMLEKQTGFQDELVLTSGRNVTAISVWDTKAHAETYDQAAYPRVLETLKPFFETSPKVQPFQVTFATHHQIV
jgi:heme-degrading monooxygenase HmoA